MNRDRIEGKWKQWSGAALRGWGRLVHDERRRAEGQRRCRIGTTQERCGWAKDFAERSVREFLGHSRIGRL